MSGTEKEQIELALQEWTAALDVLEDPIFIHDSAYRILRCNRAYQQRTGLPFKEIIGRPYFELFPKTEKPLPSCRNELEHSGTETGHTEEIEVNGTVFRSRSHAITEKDGTHLYSVHILEEITEQHRMQQALSESELRYRRLFETAKDGILLLDAETGVITDANPFILELLSCRRDECVGRKLWELGLFADAEKSEAAFRELRSRKYIRYEDLLLRTRKGHAIDVEFVSNLYTIDGEEVIQCNIRDITERKEVTATLLKEKQFSETLVQSLPDIFFLLDEMGGLLRWNKKLETLFGLPPEKMAGTNALTFVHEAERAYVAGQLEKAFESGSASAEARLVLTNGTRHYLLTGKRVETPLGSNVIGIGMDITERKKMEQQLRQEKSFSRGLVETAQIIILVLDTEGRIVSVNPYMESLSGYSSKELKGEDWFTTFLPEAERELTRKVFLHAIDDIQTLGNVSTLLTKKGEARQIAWYDKTLKDADDRTIGLLSIGMDVTEERKAQKRLELFRTLLDHSGDDIIVIDPGTMRLLDVNQTLCKNLGYSREELLSMTIYQINPTVESMPFGEVEKQLHREGSIFIETLHRRRDNTTYPVDAVLSLVELDKPYLLAISRDISNRKKAEAILRASEKKYRLLFESSRDALMILEPPSWKFTDANRATVELFGAASVKEFTSLGPWDVSPPHQPDGRPSDEKAREMIATAVREGSHLFEWMHQTIGGKPFPADVLLTRTESGGKVTIQATVRDITKRKEAEETLRRADRALRTLSAANLVLVRAKNEETLLRDATQVIVEKGGYSLATVDYADDNPVKSLTPVAWSGFEGERYWIEELGWGESEQLVPARAVRSGKTQLCREIASEAPPSPWKKAALARGYVSNIALPLFENDKAFGALSIYSTEAEPFDDEEVRLLEELANDLAYGIFNLRTRVAHEQHTALLRQSLEQSIQAIAATVESRDPYTAGHQRRVSELATAIAREMGRDNEEVEGIRFAAVIHDLGKIHIPAEILSKPGKLSELEYKLIQEHPRAGYDILKDVEFPWPIAQIILQHHERLDGSGYPQGLKEAEILPGAKIIAVADVVEAMSSHRPYRSALGLEAALEEIRRGRATLYDSDTADACLKLFAEHRFAFGTEPETGIEKGE